MATPYPLHSLLIVGILAVCPLAAVVPAQAASFMNYGFGVDIDDEDHDDDPLLQRPCILTDQGLRNAIADEGYRDIFLNAPIGRSVQARATRGGWVYLLRVNICTGEIIDRERLRAS